VVEAHVWGGLTFDAIARGWGVRASAVAWRWGCAVQRMRDAAEGCVR
jgi:hypothetical protein